MEVSSPIPNPLPDDDEDVSWALSTAGALWGRGERGEALKWLRRAAEQASDVNDDVRALALFKAAAEVAQASATTPPPPSTSVAPPPASTPAATAPSTSPPPATPQPSVPPPRRPPPSLPPRAAPPAVSPSRAPAPAPTPVPAARTAPPPAPARPVPSSSAPSPVTRQSRSAAPAPEAQISPAARSMPAAALAAASTPARGAAPAPRASTPSRGAAPAATVPTRPVASRPAAAASTSPPAAVTERPPPPSRGGRAFEEVLALQHPGAGVAFDDLDENTQVLQAVRSNPSPRKANVPETEESFRSVLADLADEVTDPALLTRRIDDAPPDDQTGPISAPERTAVTKWTEAERAALMAAPDLGGPETTTRRFAPLLAHRIAVLASSTRGELRLVLLDADAAPPIGAAVALLVPCTAADGDVVAHLIGSLE